jgi:hypothetical protein
MKRWTILYTLFGFGGILILTHLAVSNRWLDFSPPMSAAQSEQLYGPDCADNAQQPVMFPQINGFSYGIAGPPNFHPGGGNGIALSMVMDNTTSETASFTSCSPHQSFVVYVYDAKGRLVIDPENKPFGECMTGCRFNGGGTEVAPHQCFVGSNGKLDDINVGKLPKGSYDIVIIPQPKDNCGYDAESRLVRAPKFKPDGPAFRITVE